MKQKKCVFLTITFSFQVHLTYVLAFISRILNGVGSDTVTYMIEGDGYAGKVCIKAVVSDVVRGGDAVSRFSKTLPSWVSDFDSRVSAAEDSVIENQTL